MGLKSFFFEEDETAVKPADSNNSISKLTPLTNLTQPLTSTPIIGSSQDLEKFKLHFEQIFEQSNLPGPDYFELSKMVDSMGTAIPVDVRIVAAYQALKIQGVPKEKLLSSANEYIKILDNDASTFSTKVAEEIQSKKKTAEETLKLIAQKKQAVEQLQKEIDEHTLSMNDFNNIEAKMNEKTAIYQSAFNQMKTKISDDISKINQII